MFKLSYTTGWPVLSTDPIRLVRMVNETVS